MRWRGAARSVAIIALLMGFCSPARAADAAFTQFIASLWPEAQAAGVSRATFDAETRGLEPDYKLPDLILPGTARDRCAVAGGIRPGSGGLHQGSVDRAARGGGAAADAEASRGALPRSSPASACPPPSCWRSGAARPIMAAIRCPMTRSAWWRRRPMSAAARTSTAANYPGAEDARRRRGDAQGHALVVGGRHRAHAVPAVRILQARRRFRRRRPHRHLASVPDALASAAKQLVNKGWQKGVRWAYEVRAPANVDCTMGVPEVTQADRRMAARRLCAGARARG